MTTETKYTVTNSQFGFYVTVRIPLGDGKVRRMTIGAFPTRELADKVLEQAKQAEDLPEYMIEWQDELRNNPYAADLFEPKIIIFKGKHGDGHYIARTKQEFQRICLAEFKANNECGFYTHLGKDTEPIAPSFINTVDTLPEEFKKDALEKIRVYKRDLAWYNESLNLAKLRDLAKTGDLNAAEEFIGLMRGGEYETFEIITPNTID